MSRRASNASREKTDSVARSITNPQISGVTGQLVKGLLEGGFSRSEGQRLLTAGDGLSSALPGLLRDYLHDRETHRDDRWAYRFGTSPFSWRSAPSMSIEDFCRDHKVKIFDRRILDEGSFSSDLEPLKRTPGDIFQMVCYDQRLETVVPAIAHADLAAKYAEQFPTIRELLTVVLSGILERFDMVTIVALGSSIVEGGKRFYPFLDGRMYDLATKGSWSIGLCEENHPGSTYPRSYLLREGEYKHTRFTAASWVS